MPYKLDKIDFFNEVKEVLSQYPYLPYTIKENENSIVLSFSSSIKIDYVKSILSCFKFNQLQESPLKIEVTGRKNLDSFDDYKGRKVVGNVELIDIPQLDIVDLEAKLDTGATSSTIHCSSIEINDKKKNVKFIVLDKSYDDYTGTVHNFPLADKISVQSSNGSQESRPLILLKIIIQGEELETYFSLTNREDMDYPILIGKDILGGKFLIDASKI